MAIIELDTGKDEDSWAAEQLFALNSKSHVELRVRQQKAAKEYRDPRVTDVVFRQELEMPLIAALGATIVRLARAGLPKSHASYAQRPALFARGQEILESYRTLALVGDRGTGKTTLAKMLAEQLWPRSRRYLIRREYFVSDAIDMLDDFGVPIRSADAVALSHELVKLTGKIEDTSIIIDDVTDWQPLSRLVAHETARCRVIVTSNCQPPHEWSDSTLEVKDMEPDEARAMTQLITDRMAGDEAEELVTRLHYRPLAIAHCCGYLEKAPKAGANDFWRSLRSDMAVTLDTVVERSLRSVYRKTIADLEQFYPPAVRLLEAAAFCEPVWRARGYHHSSLGQATLSYLTYCITDEWDKDKRKYEPATIVLMHRKAGKILRDRYLADVDSYVTLHSFTAEIMRDLFHLQRQEIHRRLSMAGATTRLMQSLLMGDAGALYVAEILDNTSRRVRPRRASRKGGILDWVRQSKDVADIEAIRSDLLNTADVLDSTAEDYLQQVDIDLDDVD